MKAIIRFSLITFIIFSFVIANTKEPQKPEWKGKVEYEKGIKVVKNPNEPLYGEIEFELREDLSIGNEEDENYMFYRIRSIQVDEDGNIYVSDSGNHRVQKFDKDGNYLQTIGRKGQGPGEFNTPLDIQIDNKTGLIFVNDELRKIKIFDKNGNHINDIIPEELLINFYLDSSKNIWGKFSWPDYHSLNKLSPKGKIEKRLEKCPFVMTKETISEGKIGNRAYRQSFFITHGYEYDLFITKIDNRTLLYGYSKDYELKAIDLQGNVQLKIRKSEPYQKITGKEKERIKRRIRNKIISKGHIIKDISLRFPDYKPFFYALFTDTRGRIFVKKSPGEQEKYVYDIFSKDGYYLNRAIISIRPFIIKNSYLYTFTVNEETGEELIKRFRIKNWGQIKEGM